MAWISEHPSYREPWPTRYIATITLMLCAHVLALAVSARGLIKRWRADNASEAALLDQSSTLLPKSYVIPFVHAIVAIALSLAVFWTPDVWE